MKRFNRKTNEALAHVVEHYSKCIGVAADKGEAPVVRESAERMKSVDIWEMWALTQDDTYESVEYV